MPTETIETHAHTTREGMLNLSVNVGIADVDVEVTVRVRAVTQGEEVDEERMAQGLFRTGCGVDARSRTGTARPV